MVDTDRSSLRGFVAIFLDTNHLDVHVAGAVGVGNDFLAMEEAIVFLGGPLVLNLARKGDALHVVEALDGSASNELGNGGLASGCIRVHFHHQLHGLLFRLTQLEVVVKEEPLQSIVRASEEGTDGDVDDQKSLTGRDSNDDAIPVGAGEELDLNADARIVDFITPLIDEIGQGDHLVSVLEERFFHDLLLVLGGRTRA